MKMTIAKRLVFFLSFMLLIETVCGNTLKEVLIWTPNNGKYDHWSGNVFNYYTNLNNYPLKAIQEKCLNFSVMPYGSKCHYKFVLLSERSDLQTYNYYEIYSGTSKMGIRRGGDGYDYSFTYGPAPANCEEFKEYSVQWDNQGGVTVIYKNIYSVVKLSHPWASSSPPFKVEGIGIKTGFGDEGLWKIKHHGDFTDFYCVNHQMYGDMDILVTSNEPKATWCAALCSQKIECQGLNYNDKTKQCELIRSGQLVRKIAAQDWRFSSKCLNNKILCMGC